MKSTPSLIKRLVDLAFNQGDLASLGDFVAVDGFTNVMNWGMPAGRLRLKQLITIYRTGFPDLHCNIEDEISMGDRSAALWTMHGTHNGRFLGNQPTGRSILVQGIIFARLEEEKIVAYWMLIDQFSLLQQLGVIPR